MAKSDPARKSKRTKPEKKIWRNVLNFWDSLTKLARYEYNRSNDFLIDIRDMVEEYLFSSDGSKIDVGKESNPVKTYVDKQITKVNKKIDSDIDSLKINELKQLQTWIEENKELIKNLDDWTITMQQQLLEEIRKTDNDIRSWASSTFASKNHGHSEYASAGHTHT